MEQSAIKQIQQSSAELAHEAAESLASATQQYPFVMVPEGFKVQKIDVEEHEQFRRRFRGSLRTASLNDFTTYCLTNKLEHSTCFISPEEMSAKVIIDHGSREAPGHCQDNAHLKLEKTPEYCAFLDVCDRSLSQKALAEWLEEWLDCVTFFDGDNNTIDPRKAISSIRKITIEANAKSETETQSFREEKSAFESIEAKHDDNRPHEIHFSCKPYDDLKMRTLSCKLSIITGEATPVLKLRSQRLSVAVQEMGTELKEILTEKFNGEIQTYLADFRAVA